MVLSPMVSSDQRHGVFWIACEFPPTFSLCATRLDSEWGTCGIRIFIRHRLFAARNEVVPEFLSASSRLSWLTSLRSVDHVSFVVAATRSYLVARVDRASGTIGADQYPTPWTAPTNCCWSMSLIPDSVSHFQGTDRTLHFVPPLRVCVRAPTRCPMSLRGEHCFKTRSLTVEGHYGV